MSAPISFPPLPGAERRFARLRAAFTLVEILVSLAVLSILLLISAQVIGQVQSTWSASNARISQFREARTAFDILTRNLSQATLNTYVDYDTNYLENTATAADAAAPDKYVRKSDLQFVCGPAEDLVLGGGGDGDSLPGDAVFFQAPLGVAQQPGLVGLDRLLCGRGYFVQYSNDSFFAPEGDFLINTNPRFRYRLIEFSPPAEKNLIYRGGTIPWYENAGAPMEKVGGAEDATNRSLNRPVADNIIALIISPREERAVTSINGDSAFDSKLAGVTNVNNPQGTQHLLPPMLKVLLVAIDEKSAERLTNYDTDSDPPLNDELNDFYGVIEQGNASDAAIEQALNGVGGEGGLKRALTALRINYRVFSATVQIRGSKWSM